MTTENSNYHPEKRVIENTEVKTIIKMQEEINKKDVELERLKTELNTLKKDKDISKTCLGCGNKEIDVKLCYQCFKSRSREMDIKELNQRWFNGDR